MSRYLSQKLWTRRATSLAVLGVLAFLLVSCAGEPERTLSTRMTEFFGAPDVESLGMIIDELVASDASSEEIAQMLRQGRSYSTDVETGWTVYTVEAVEGQPRPYHVYVPASYDPSVSYTVVFDLHGAVSRQPEPAESLEYRRGLWEVDAEVNEWILVVPHGDYLATWYSANGHANIRDELEALKQRYNVNENMVFVSGISDGGSGAFWLGFHDPTPWAGMISFHGHPGVVADGPYQVYPRNLANRPIRATSGEEDELYPPRGVSPFIDLFVQLGAEIEWVIYPGGHSVEFLEQEAELTIEFIATTERDPFAPEVVWETSHTEVGRCDWVRIDKITDVGNNEEFRDMNLAEANERPMFGAALAYRGGTLFTVAGVEPESVAQQLGIRNGDQVIRIDDHPVMAPTDIGVAMAGKTPGSFIEIEVIRDGKALILSDRIAARDPIYRRDSMTGSIQATADGNRIDVKVSHVGSYTLFISSQQFDLSQPIQVTTNGETTFSRLVAPDIRFMLEQAAADCDREMVYEATIEIVVPEGS